MKKANKFPNEWLKQGKSMNKILAICSLFLLVGCQPIMSKLYGIKKPAVENEQSILKKAHKFGLDTTNIITVNSHIFAETMSKQAIPDAAIYDRNGNYIEYRETDTSCNAGLFDFIPNLSLNIEYNQPDRPIMNEVLLNYRELDGNPVGEIQTADFYVLIYWTVWSGKLNTDHVKVWEELARDNKKCKIQIIKVNLDIQEYWDADEREKIMKMMNTRKK